MKTKAKKCNQCGAAINALTEFPGGVCLECWDKAHRGDKLPSASEWAQAWRGCVRVGR